MTRTEVCALLGVAPKTLYLWERAGRTRAPRRDRRGWRQYSEADVRALRKHLGHELAADPDRVAPANQRRLAGLSARNQLSGRVAAIKGGGVLCEVSVTLGDGQEITAVITRQSAERLGLRRGAGVVAVIKATEVMLFR